MTNWEAIALIHADCDGLEPEQLLQKHGPLRATAYHKGDVGSGGRTHTISAFKVDLGSATSKAELEERVLTHLRDHAALYGEVAKNSGHVSLGIGLMVPPKEPRTVTLTPRALRVLLEAGITVHVTAYPCMEDEGEEIAQ